MTANHKPTGYQGVLSSPIGCIGITIHEAAVVGLDILSPLTPPMPPTNEPATRVMDEITHYFELPGWRFTVPVRLTGTAFQCAVWRALRDIPAGQVLTYGELAQRLHTSARAVGGACRRNPLPLIVPCHRVVAKTGLGGFMGVAAGGPVSIKQWLLGHEQRG